MKDEESDYLFERLTVEQLARHMTGRVNEAPSAEKVKQAKWLIEQTGHLYRLRAHFDSGGGQA